MSMSVPPDPFLPPILLEMKKEAIAKKKAKFQKEVQESMYI